MRWTALKAFGLVELAKVYPAPSKYVEAALVVEAASRPATCRATDRERLTRW